MTPERLPPGYRSVSLLGSGQTSHVFLAEHVHSGRVALKLPRTELNDRPVLRRMFENEVQITLSLKHPNIVGAYEGYPTGERAFLALEYCGGGTLDQMLLERGRLALEHAYRLILSVARGLDHSHASGVVHRDVKPANVFLTESGDAKLGDFGTGMYVSDKPTEQVGTAFYMAPEIFQGANPSVRSDIYSLGILAYEVIAGSRPFAGETYDSLMMAHLSGLPKPLRHFRAELPTSVARVVGTAMARDGERRFKTVREFVAAFEQAIGGLAERPTPQSPQLGRASRTPQPAKVERRGILARLFGWRKA